MNENDFLTSNLNENVYYSNNKSSEVEIRKQIMSFLSELYKRRKNDMLEDGLQAAILIMPDAFAAKVNEEDGDTPHLLNIVNMERYMKGEKNFYNEKTPISEIYDKYSDISSIGVQVRILDANEEIEFPIMAYNSIQSEFQLKVLEELTNSLKVVQTNKYYSNIRVGMNTPNTDIDVENFNDEIYKRLKSALDMEKILIKKEEVER